MNYVIAVIAGLLLGMLVNYLADVLPVHRRFVHPSCMKCGSQISWKRYFIWPRRCLECGTPRSVRVWLVEAGLAGAGGYFFINPPEKFGVWIGLILLSFLVLVTVIDVEHRLIMHIISAAGALLALWIGISLHGLIPTLIGGAAGFGLMLGIYYLGFLFIRLSRRMRGKAITEEDAIGFGDVNLAGITGLLLGWPGIILGLVLAIVLAGTASLFFLVWNILKREYDPNLTLPYGPFLTASVFILLFLKPQSWFL